MAKYPWEHLDKSCHPKQCLFMSIDAIGSTQLKTSLSKPTSATSTFSPYPWVEALLDFLPETHVIYADHFNNRIKCCPRKKQVSPCPSSCSAPSVWKFIGDEVVLLTELGCLEQIYYHLHTLRDVLRTLNKKFTERTTTSGAENPIPLEFKATAWVAAFPVTNVEVNLPTTVPVTPGKKSPSVTDCIGPSIDLGFRLAKHATKSRLVISASLAKFVHELANDPLAIQPLDIYTGGFVELKGVRDGKHPLFWLTTYDTEKLEEHLLTPVNPKNLTSFFSHYFEDVGPPFILSRGHISTEYVKSYKNAMAQLQKNSYTVFWGKKEEEQILAAESDKNTKDFTDEVIAKLSRI